VERINYDINEKWKGFNIMFKKAKIYHDIRKPNTNVCKKKKE
jgi:hypothetical protein